MIRKLQALCPAFCTGILNSYSQVFFSDNKWFAGILILVSFLDLNAGISGLAAVVLSNFFASLIGFNLRHIRLGYYGFNSLLAGLGIGVYYQPGIEYYVLLVFVTVLTLFLTVAMEGVIGKYGLPFLSIPFLISVWMVTLAARQFTSLVPSEHGIFMMNELFDIGKTSAVNTYSWLNEIPLPFAVKLYFRSLGAIFFQYHLFAGVLIATGLLIYSRIAFTLSLLGFFAAYAYYHFIGASIYELSAGYIGFNFILTSIAVGGFFIIPSWYSYLWVLLLTPLVSVLVTGTHTLFSLFQLSVFSLPFNLTVLLFLYALKFRERSFLKPETVNFQQFSPEKNLYARRNYLDRFSRMPLTPVMLPFFGTWKVTQGHNGTPTHQSDWRHAWDFEVESDEGVPFSGSAIRREDFLAFNRPVLAPADGTVEEAVSDIGDNDIGSMDLRHNWGNTVVIRHSDQLFTQISHLRKDSVRVRPGNRVKQGDVIGSCGNSGRSPKPHLHLHIQTTPYIGSATLDYPLGHYILHRKEGFFLKSYEKPEHGQQVSNIEKLEVLEQAFHFIPGQKIRCRVSQPPGSGADLTWEVVADSMNYTYILCHRTRSRAYFRFDGHIHFFTHFEGKRNSLLFYFFTGAYQVITGFYKGLQVRDRYPLSLLNSRALLVIQDFIAPFRIFMKPEYCMTYLSLTDDLTDPRVQLHSAATVRIGRREVRRIGFDFSVTREGIETFCVTDRSKTEVHLHKS